MKYEYYDSGYLPKDRVFVFGSNIAGRHGLGAALTALRRYGAKYGIGVGYVGNSYAIPTKDKALKVLPLRDIVPYIQEFVQFTIDNPTLRFYVTPVGCGLAGYKPNVIGEHFKGAVNCVFPSMFEQYLEV